jgi:hypothetical protein
VVEALLQLGQAWDAASSGKLTYGKSPFYSWVNQLFLWQVSIAMLNYQRVVIIYLL